MAGKLNCISDRRRGGAWQKCLRSIGTINRRFENRNSVFQTEAVCLSGAAEQCDAVAAFFQQRPTMFRKQPQVWGAVLGYRRCNRRMDALDYMFHLQSFFDSFLE